MSDIDEFKAFFDKHKVKYEPMPELDMPQSTFLDPHVTALRIESYPDNLGYSGFYVEFYFDVDGKYTSVGVYE